MLSKTSQECETALTSQYKTLFLVICLFFFYFVFSSLWSNVWIGLIWVELSLCCVQSGHVSAATSFLVSCSRAEKSLGVQTDFSPVCWVCYCQPSHKFWTLSDNTLPAILLRYLHFRFCRWFLMLFILQDELKVVGGRLCKLDTMCSSGRGIFEGGPQPSGLCSGQVWIHFNFTFFEPQPTRSVDKIKV